MNLKGKRRTLFLLLAVMVLAGGYWLWQVLNAPVPQYQTLIVRPGELQQNVLATGKLDALRKVDVGAQVSGQLKTLSVEIGDKVKKGQLLGVIDPEQAENQIREVEATLMELRAQRAQALAERNLAQVTLTRQQALAKTQAISKQDLDTATTELAVKQAQIGTIDAQIKRNQASLDTAKTNLDYTKIVGRSHPDHHAAGPDGDCRAAGAEHSDAGGHEHHAGQSPGLGGGRYPSQAGTECLVYGAGRSADALRRRAERHSPDAGKG